MRSIHLRWLIGSVVLAVGVSGSASAEFPSNDVIHGVLRARVDTFKQSVGIVVGVVDSTGTRFVSYGTTHVDGTAPVDEHTIFEIGSISKVFTSIILADMVRKGEVDFRDPVQKFLPPEVVLPVSEGRAITLSHLATHRSGLPRMPNNFAHGAGGMTDPYPLDRMYEFPGTCTLASDVGENYLYSNLGFGLLGQVLAIHAETDLETLLVDRVCVDHRPLLLGLGPAQRVEVDHPALEIHPSAFCILRPSQFQDRSTARSAIQRD